MQYELNASHMLLQTANACAYQQFSSFTIFDLQIMVTLYNA